MIAHIDSILTNPAPNKPVIVAFEGGDQAGKQTQSLMLQKALRRQGTSSRVFSFPDYTTPVGRLIKRHLSGRAELTVQALHCLLSANRWERFADIKKAASAHRVVIMNRYYHSNVAYGMANGMGRAWLESLDAGLPRTNLVILLDVTQPESFRRKPGGRDRLERGKIFTQDVLRRYRRMARRGRWKIVDASQTAAQVHGEVMEAVLKKI